MRSTFILKGQIKFWLFAMDIAYDFQWEKNMLVYID